MLSIFPRSVFVLKISLPTTSRLYCLVNFFTWLSFSSCNTLQVMYTNFPFFFKYLRDLDKIYSCFSTLCLSIYSLNLSLRSGFLLIVPVPVQGTSKIIQSTLFCNVFSKFASSLWNWTFWIPARWNLCLAFYNILARGSWRNSCPFPSSKWEIAKDLPPLPLQ